MSLISSLIPASRVAVIGASGGLGAAFLGLLERDHRVADVYAFARRPDSVRATRATVLAVELTDELSIAAGAETVARSGPLDLVLVATGLLQRRPGIQPEKSLRDLNPAVLAEVMAINALGPAMVAKHFLPHMRREAKTVFAALSARVGSIGDNRLGGWASYRTSKAALNMLVRTIAIEHRRRFPDSVVVALHPGTVATPLSRPFASRVPRSQLFTPAESATRLLGVIDGLSPADSGGFFAWDGAPVVY